MPTLIRFIKSNKYPLGVYCVTGPERPDPALKEFIILWREKTNTQVTL